MDRIKKIFEKLEKTNYFKVENVPSEEIKEKITYIKKINKICNLREYHNNPDAVPKIIIYYFQIKVNELFIKYFEFKINYNALKENIDYLNDCLNDIIKNNEHIFYKY